MNANPQVFLDTSIQIDRLIGAAAQQTAIAKQLAIADIDFVTTAYVFMEFQRGLLADYVRIYNTLLHSPTWQEAAYRLRSGPLAYRPRALGRCMQILTQVITMSQMNHDHALNLLKATIQYDLPNRFWHQVVRLPDPIVCDLVTAGVNLQADNRCTIADSCRKELATCHLPDFLADHRTELQTIIGYLTAHPQAVKQQARVEKLLHTVLEDPGTALGQTSCWPLGDVIIALQALSSARIWSIDADFRPLAQALGLSLYEPIPAK